MKLRLFFCLLFIAASLCKVFAQPLFDTLKTVEIKANKAKDTVADEKQIFTTSQYRQSIDTQFIKVYQNQDLGQVLAQQSPVFIKSYGVNSMSTLALRGASAAQSTVLWNGVPINNPAIGMADLSLLRTGLFQQISLLYGSSAGLFGSGNVGGALILGSNNPDFSLKKNVSLSAAVGSFGRRDIVLSSKWQNRKWSIGVNGFTQKSENDIKYLNSLGKYERLTNAQSSSSGILASVAYNIGKKWTASSNHKVYMDLWLQQYNRQIPPALFEPVSVKNQMDQSLRMVAGWEKKSAKTFYYFKSSFSSEQLLYNDSITSTFSNNTMQQYFHEFGAKYNWNGKAESKINRQQVLFFFPWQYTWARGTNIKEHNYQSKPALGAAYQMLAFSELVEFNASLRQEMLNGIFVPLLPGLGVKWKLLDWKGLEMGVMANLQRTYRIPGLNELYYFPGGNDKLKPEQGWSQDIGYLTKFGNEKLSIEHNLNAFNRNIKDWIYWLGGAIWTPYNIAKVHSRGLETANKIAYKTHDFTFTLGFNYAYILSTSEESYLPGDGSLGKQIPYAPRYNYISNLGISWRNLWINYNHNFTGYRFTTIDESLFLLPYHVGNLQCSYEFRKPLYSFQIVGQVQNLWNQDYLVVAGRPMPGRNFLLQVKLLLND